MSEPTQLQNEEDAANYRNLLKARTMIALGDKDPIWQALVDAFEARVKAQAQSVVSGS